MERIILKQVGLDEIASDDRYCLRFRCDDAALEQSIKKRGMLSPVIVTGGANKILLAGHKRTHIAKKLKMESLHALEIRGEQEAEDLWLAAVFSNWNQTWPDLDRAYALQKTCVKFRLPEAFVIEELMPAMGLVPEKHVLSEYLKAGNLDSGLLECIASGRIPFRGAAALAKFSAQDQRSIAKQLVPFTAFTVSQWGQLAEWLSDLMRLEKKDLTAFFERSGIATILNHAQWDARTKSERVLQLARSLRFPQLCNVEEQFRSVSRAISPHAADLKIEAPPSFEDEGFWLHAKIRDANALERVSETLRDKRDLLNSLFDIML